MKLDERLRRQLLLDLEQDETGDLTCRGFAQRHGYEIPGVAYHMNQLIREGLAEGAVQSVGGEFLDAGLFHLTPAGHDIVASIRGQEASGEGPLDEADRRELRRFVEHLQHRLEEELDLGREERDKLRAELAELRTEFATFSRGRWRRMFYGVMVKLAVDGVLPVGIVNTIVRDAATGLRSILPDLQLPPGLG